jgi:flagellar hook-length control protein FliK
MQTQTVQNSPLLSGNTAPARPSSPAQDDQQFAQALNHQIERQANNPPPRAEAPKPAAPQPHAEAGPQPKPAAPAPAPAKQAQAPAKAQQAKQPENNAQSSDAPDAPAGTPADAASAAAKPAADGKSADAAEQTDAQKAAGEAAADMLAMLQGLAQPAAGADAAAAAAAAAASASAARPATDAALAGDAVLDGKGGRSGIADRLPAEGLPVDQAALLSAKTAAQDAGKDQAAAGDQDPALAGAASRLAGHGAAEAAGKDQPRTDFQSALQQANVDAGKAAKAAELDAKQAIQPQAGAIQAAATALAPLGAANAQAAEALASNQLHARVGSQGWDHQLGQKVVWMINGGEQSATLTLNPPDLGPLQVVLNVSHDQASVAFTAAQPEVRAALEQALPKLRETMGEAGIALGNASVSAGSQEQQQAFAETAAGGRGRGAAHGQNGNTDEGDPAARPAPQIRRGVLSAVDTFA